MPAAFTRDWYACKVLEAVLTAGQTSVLNRRLRGPRSPVGAVASSTIALVNGATSSSACRWTARGWTVRRWPLWPQWSASGRAS